MTCPRCGTSAPPRDGVCGTCGEPSPAGDQTILPGGQPPADQTTLPSAAGVGGDEAPLVPDAPGATMVPSRPPDPDSTILPQTSPAPEATVLPLVPADPDGTVTPESRPPARSRTDTGSSVGTTGGASAVLEVGQPFGSRYHIIRVLGEGGMGAVYQAWDEELGVAVALKVIRPEVLSDPVQARELERRFKRELLLARQVTHKNVVRIHDLGEVEGIKYITMTFVHGDDLATALKKDGRLPVPRVLAAARQVVSGLQAAHEAGVVHRDLKPANIMMDADGSALIMDFGIALSTGDGEKKTGQAGAAAQASAVQDDAATMMGAPPPPDLMRATGSGTILSTRSGGIVGTLEYMAPEQARGEKVDHRADIYAFGLILSDLLTGRREAKPGSTPWDTLTDRITTAPAPLRGRCADIPEALDAVVTKCVQLDPAARYQTTAELAAALSRLDDEGNSIPEPVVKRFTPKVLAAAAALVMTLVGGTYFLARGPGEAPPPPEPMSVLIADFANNTQEPVFNGLIEQAMTVGVEGASFVSAYPRADALKVAGQVRPGSRLDDATAALVALREGVDRVITGAISKDGSRYRVDVRLIDPSEAAEQQVLASWDGQASDRDAVLPAVARLATSVREGLGDTTAASDATRDEESFTASSLEAAQAYTAAQEFQWAGKYQEAFDQYKRASELDPTMGRAFSGLGAMASSLGRTAEAEEYYKQALGRLNRMTDREKYRTRGGYYLLTRNSDKAREEMQALVQQYPADSAGLINLALAEFYRRNMAKSVELGLQASALLPRNVLYKNNTALFAMYAGNFELAEKEASGVLEINPEFAKAFVAIALSQLALDRVADADTTWRRLEPLPGSATWFEALGLADLAMYQGKLSDAATLLDAAVKAEADPSRQARLLVTLAEVRNLQGRWRDAVKLARQATTVSDRASIAFLAGRELAKGGQTREAFEIVRKLLQRLDAESLANARVLEGEIALEENDPRKAIERFKTAQQFADSWLGRFGLGRAYLAAGAIAEADSEFDLCFKRRGEATAVLLDDVPTYRLFAPVLYYQGRVRQELGSPDASASYEAFVALKANGDEQGLVADARTRLAAQ